MHRTGHCQNRLRSSNGRLLSSRSILGQHLLEIVIVIVGNIAQIFNFAALHRWNPVRGLSLVRRPTRGHKKRRLRGFTLSCIRNPQQLQLSLRHAQSRVIPQPPPLLHRLRNQDTMLQLTRRAPRRRSVPLRILLLLLDKLHDALRTHDLLLRVLVLELPHPQLLLRPREHALRRELRVRDRAQLVQRVLRDALGLGHARVVRREPRQRVLEVLAQAQALVFFRDEGREDFGRGGGRVHLLALALETG
ncbi:unnamed protein product [Mycena citricolor]|uniref:Uncharacterized protein n=1 Tax=Mycena citricolor TaxID=2018698 RepID=A0AAD2Q730_9AGAR|nr:unnamed protein product [Mycena citricolor]